MCLESEADQRHEQLDVRDGVEAQCDPLRAGHQPDGGRGCEVFLEPLDGPGREVQVDVIVGVEVGDLSVGRT
jgi:hypothetical protein